MAVQLLAVAEGGGEDPHKRRLALRQPQGIVRVHRGEAGVAEGTGPAVHGDDSGAEIRFFKEASAVEAVFRVVAEKGALQLELYDGDGLVHLRRQGVLHGVVDHVIQRMGIEEGAGVVPVHVGCEDGEGTEIQPVAVLQHIVAVVAQSDADHVGDEGGVPGGGSHPAHVVVAPLKVHVLEGGELVHDPVGAGATVEDIPDDVEAVHGEGADQGAEGRDELVRHVGEEDGGDELRPVVLPVHVVGDVQKLVEDGAEGCGHLLADLRPGVFGGDGLGHLDQPVEGQGAPLPVDGPSLSFLLEDGLRGVDQLGQSGPLGGGQALFKDQVDLGANHAGGGAEQAGEGVVLPVQVAEEILRPLGQGAQGGEADDLGGGGFRVGVIPGQQLQIPPVGGSLLGHGRLLYFSVMHRMDAGGTAPGSGISSKRCPSPVMRQDSTHPSALKGAG